MEILFEIIFQFVGELLLQIFFEALAEIGLRSVSEPFRKRPNPWVAAVGYVFFGGLLGGLSLLFFPALFIESRDAQIANLVFAPVAAGAVMAAIGSWRLRRNQELIRLDRFVYGYLFALAMAIVRFSFGR